jgi:hypothetical protein
MNYHIRSLFLTCFAIISLSFAGCEKNEQEITMEKLSFHIHNVSGGNEIKYGNTYTDNSGRKFSVSLLRYYISNIVLIKDGGEEYPITGKYLLVSPEMDSYELGEVPSGKYQGLRYYLGIDSITNHADPTVYPASDPLALQDPPMHWDWNSGYIFVQMEGLYDSTAAATGTPTSPYFFHIGMDMCYRLVDLSNQPFEIISGNEFELALEANINQLLNGVNLLNENSTHTFNNVDLALKIADNSADMFELE